MPLKSRINEIIKVKGYRKKWVAEQLGISSSYLSQWCKNNERGVAENPPNALYSFRLAYLLGCRVDDLFEYREEDAYDSNNNSGNGNKPI